jgi:general stress protein CsbA
MEILIDVPSYLHPVIERILQYWSYIVTIWTLFQEYIIYIYHGITSLSFLSIIQHAIFQWPWMAGTISSSSTTTATNAITSTLSTYTSNVIVPIVAIVFVFWPILLSIIMAVVTAWAWIFWLFTSILLGIVQVGYASYQFFMITMDICGISILKTYVVVVRNRFLYIFDTKKSRQTSRRKIWWKRLEQASNYEDFLKIRIEPKNDVHHSTSTGSRAEQGKVNRNSTGNGSSRSIWNNFFPSRSGRKDSTNDNDVDEDGTPYDTALPPRIIGRSNSFTSSRSMNDGESQPLSPSKIVMLRNLSFSGTEQYDSSNGSCTSGHRGNNMTVQCRDPIAIQELGRQTADLLVSTTYRLEQSRLACIDNPENNAEPISTMQYLLAGVVKRNHLQLDELLVQNARSIAEMGYYGLSKYTRHIIKSYYQEVEKCLDYIADAPIVQQQQSAQPQQGFSIITDHHHRLPHGDLFDRITLLRKMKQNMGRTALMLSGGGAQAMYHLGVIKALIESKLYDDIKVISGTSGGSITAAMCAIKTADELYTDVCVNTVSTDFMRTGEMKKHNIRWFPPMYDMATYWIKHKLLVDSAYFGRTCEFYFKDYTFEEAFIRTGKHVCITVSASRASGTTAQRLLLNHISTPHVTIASAYVPCRYNLFSLL